MKIALLQDQLLTCAGSERVFLYMCQEFPEADIFSLCYNAKTTLPEFEDFSINVHPLNRIIRTHKIFKMLFPISTYAMELWDFRGYDLIISSSATTAKYIKRFSGVHICYCYIPTRAIWNFGGYFQEGVGFKEKIFSSFLNYFKKRDVEAARRVTKFLAISDITKNAITDCYGCDSEVLFAPIDLPEVRDNNLAKKDFYLIVSRLEKWKRLEYAIQSFNQLGLPLLIVGKGPELARLKSLANENIVFMGGVDDSELSDLYSQALALIFTPELEYGLVPIEAAAHGTPSIALGKGGVLETMIGHSDGCKNPTAVFFDKPTAESLVAAVNTFRTLKFDSSALIKHASLFSIPIFRSKLRNIVNKFMADYK
jgi:glycosyltransferase involved in cell wall biosynthesis